MTKRMMMMMTGVMTWRDNRRARVLVVKLLSLRFMFMPQRLSLTFTMPMTAMTRPISYVWPTKPFWFIKQSTQCPVHTQCCVFPKSGVDQQEGAGCWKRSMIILGIWCIFELLLAVLCSVLCRAELGGWLPYHGRIKRSRPSSFDQGAACSDLSINLLLLAGPLKSLHLIPWPNIRAPFSVLDFS